MSQDTTLGFGSIGTRSLHVRAGALTGSALTRRTR